MDFYDWRQMQCWIMEGWFMADVDLECYDLVWKGQGEESW